MKKLLLALTAAAGFCTFGTVAAKADDSDRDYRRHDSYREDRHHYSYREDRHHDRYRHGRSAYVIVRGRPVCRDVFFDDGGCYYYYGPRRVYVSEYYYDYPRYYAPRPYYYRPGVSFSFGFGR